MEGELQEGKMRGGSEENRATATSWLTLLITGRCWSLAITDCDVLPTVNIFSICQTAMSHSHHMCAATSYSHHLYAPSPKHHPLSMSPQPTMSYAHPQDEQSSCGMQIANVNSSTCGKQYAVHSWFLLVAGAWSCPLHHIPTTRWVPIPSSLPLSPYYSNQQDVHHLLYHDYKLMVAPPTLFTIMTSRAPILSCHYDDLGK